MDMETMARVPRHRFSVAEYYRMGEVGILGEDDRVELVDGQIVEMPPIGPGHATSVTAVANRLAALVGDRALVRTQQPVRLGDLSEPLPDVALVRPPNDRYADAHPVPDDVLLLIEVAETTAPYDHQVKIPLYARAGVPECWLVDLRRNVVEVHRSPGRDRYAERRELRPGDRVAPAALPEAALDVAQILGAPHSG
jgi:Uma2 family endonuclease